MMSVSGITRASVKPLETQIVVSSHQRASVVTVAGDLDIATVPSLRHAIAGALSGGEPEVVLDLRQVSVIDSSALGILVGAFKRARAEDCLLTLVCSPSVGDTLRKTGLDTVLHIAESHASLH